MKVPLMVCKECGTELIASNPPNVVEDEKLHQYYYCSHRCAALYALSDIWGFDRSALLPLVTRSGEDFHDLRSRLEDVVTRLMLSPRARHLRWAVSESAHALVIPARWGTDPE
jgi:hypothetical protein